MDPFDVIVGNEVQREADRHLDEQLQATRNWKADKEDHDLRTDAGEYSKEMLKARARPGDRGRTMLTLAAALLRLAELEDNRG